MADVQELVAAYKAQGNARYQSQQYDQAVELYSKAIALDPSNHVLYSNRSAAHSNKPDAAAWRAALADADTATRLAPGWAKGHVRKSTALRKLGRPAHAERALRDALAGACGGDPALAVALAELLRQEDGEQSPLHGAAGERLRAQQADVGMRVASLLSCAPCEAHFAAFCGDLGEFRQLFDPPRHAALRPTDMRLPLTTIIVAGAQRTVVREGDPRPPHAELLDVVLREGWCRVDARDAAGYTALEHAASHHPRLDLARVLHRHGADPSARDRLGSCALIGAICGMEPEAVRWLLE